MGYTRKPNDSNNKTRRTPPACCPWSLFGTSVHLEQPTGREQRAIKFDETEQNGRSSIPHTVRNQLSVYPDSAIHFFGEQNETRDGNRWSMYWTPPPGTFPVSLLRNRGVVQPDVSQLSFLL